MKKRIGFLYKGKKFEIDVVVCNSFGRFFGLMFKGREKSQALLFDFKRPTKIGIHSFFVFFPFFAVWLNSEGKVLDLKVLRPFGFPVFPKKHFIRLIEIPISRKYSEIIKLLVGD